MDRARQLRQTQTDAEALAWAFLRNRNCLGFKFRRQVVISGFIVDFYCPELRLVIELNGSVHDSQDQRLRDRERDAVLTLASVRVVRIRNAEVNRARLVETIRSASMKTGLEE